MMDSIIVGTKDCSISAVVTKILRSPHSLSLFYEKWTDVAYSLGATSGKLKTLRDDLRWNRKTLSEVIHELIDDWVSREAENAALEVLVIALGENGMNFCGELLEWKLMIPTHSSSIPKPSKLSSWKELVVGSEECPFNTVEPMLRDNLIIQEDWSFLASQLGVSNVELKIYKSDFQFLDKITYSELLRKILESWVGLQGSNAKLMTLVDLVEADKFQAYGVGESLRLRFNWPCRLPDYENPSIFWKDLSPAFQLRVKENLHKLFPNLPNCQQCLPDLKDKILFDLMMGRSPRLFQHRLPKHLKYYVDRTLLTRNIISNKIFNQNSSSSSSNDIFLFTGIERHQLSVFAKGMTASSNEQLKDITVRFIILDQPNHFEVICKHSNEPVHWLHQEEDGKLRWVKSSGTMGALQKFVEAAQDSLPEEGFIQELNNPHWNLPVVISDTPGMGKSVLLAQIGSRLTQLFPERAVMFIVLSEFVNYVKLIGVHVKVKKMAIGKALLDLTCDNELAKLVFQSKLGPQQQPENNIIVFELLLDGLDEVHSDDVAFTHECLQIIKSSFKFVRLWITTRSHLLNELESNLSVLGYNMLPFDQPDQLRFLSSYWSQDKLLNLDKLKKFAKYCLKILKRNIKSEDEDIAGIPLQCLLIAEVYEEDAIQHSNDGGENSSTFPEIIIDSITGLYKVLISMKFKKYLTSHQKNDYAGNESSMDMHIKLSLQLLFPSQFEKLQHLFDREEIEPMLKVGIVESSDTIGTTMPRFVHRTFAEYFIAYFVVDRLSSGWGWWRKFREKFVLPILNPFSKKEKCWSKELAHFLVQSVFDSQRLVRSGGKISYKFRHHIISYFVNSLISHMTTLVSPNSIQHFGESFKSRENMKRIVHACNNSNFLQIFKFFDGLQAFQIHGETIFHPKFVLYSTQFSSLDFLRFTFNHFEEHHSFSSNSDLQRESISVAVRRAEFSIVEYLLKEKQLGTKFQHIWSRTLIHECVQESKDNSEGQLHEKRQILGALASTNPSLLENRDGLGRTPLLSDHIHIQLMTEIVRLGGNVFAKDGWSDGILHLNLFRSHLSSRDYHSLVMSISEERLRKLVKVKGKWGHTPLISLVDWKDDPCLETLERFEAVKADFNNVEDEDGYSALAIAIKHKRRVEIVKKLIDLGSSVKWRGRKGNSLLHVAAQSRNVEAVNYLVNEYKMEVNVKDSDGFTPLDRAIEGMRKGQRFERDTIIALHQLGGTFKDIVNSDGQSWLHVATLEGNYDLVHLLLKEMEKEEHILIRRVDYHGNTALHLGVKESKGKFNCFDITRLLLDCGGEAVDHPKSVNNQGELPLHLALKNRHLDLATFHALRAKTDGELNEHYNSIALEFVKRNERYLKDEEYVSLIREFGGVPSPSKFFRNEF